ncbi:MAG TPA: SRPBCC family protein [Solirubrobacteraceae bacterium]|nr:SRPBCC family protein [Solirubrobacteraceae bacterium]
MKRTQSIEIARSPEEVFAYLTDPSKLSTWQDADEVTQLTPGPLGAGTRLREVHRTLGRPRVEITEFVVYEPGRRFDIRMIDGPPLDGRWDFAPSAAGTRLTFTPIVRLTGLRQRLEPVLVIATRVVFRRFHRRLKRALEAD